MERKKNGTMRDLARWLRIGALTLSTLGPVLDMLVTRLRKRAVEERQEPVQPVDWQQRLVVVGGALSDLLSELQHNPYAQDLLKRGEDVAEELIERGSKLSQRVVKRGSQWSQDIARRGGDLTHDLTERGQQVTGELSRRGQQARQELVERSSPLGLAAGFGIGLLSASLAVYLLIRKRLLRNALVEEPSVEISHNGHNSDDNIATNFDRIAEASPAEQVSTTAEDSITGEVAPVDEVPFDAVLVGVVSTQRYYPIENRPDQLKADSAEAVEVIYFVSEQEAKEQGYLPAE